MSTRIYLFSAAIVVAVVSVSVVVIDHDSKPAAVQHGNFSERFQPVPPASSTKDRERLASIGSIRDLRPVDLGGK